MVFRMVALFWFLFAQVLEGAPQAAPKQGDNGDPLLGHRIAKGVVFEDRLWLRGTDVSRKGGQGGLISLGLSDDSRTVHFERGVVDIEKSGHELLVLRQTTQDVRHLVVSAWRKGTFQDLASFSLSGKDDPLALFDDAGNPGVLSHKALRILSGDQHDWRVITLKGELRGGVQISVAPARNGKDIYLGFNHGEWGGGLQRVNVETGAITNVERRDTKELCNGPLNSDCDPVTGVVADPKNADCIFVAVGLVHMFTSEGRILRVCGERVTPIAEEPTTGGIGGKMKMTEAFYGLAPVEDGSLWGITWRALYRFSADGKEEAQYALPKLKPISGIYLSRELPGVIVVSTDVNWAVSTSGYTPLVIPLENSETHKRSSE
ncbi:MAG TPA: hypothetical protein VJN89_13245 [Candidatus Acidoferrum sp.]|nr:hypothetical protein [Candidatus Acidoferrum sp.]